MEIIKTVSEMQKISKELKSSGKSTSFVPTMGFFHEGHLKLMRDGRKSADILVVSIFVNPTQFGPAEDLEKYPRDMDGDLAKAKDVGADIVFCPSPEEMYPDGFQTKITVEKITKFLCGSSRPTHFEGVATVVAKLFNIVKPDLALFGQKDFQQLAVIQRMARDLNMDIRILGVPIVRESDGLAMSSRNSYLNAEERRSALCLKESIDLAGEMVQDGEKNSEIILMAVRKLILGYPYTKIDYVNICDPKTMEDRDTIEGERLLALAVFVGKTRLIDNCIIEA